MSGWRRVWVVLSILFGLPAAYIAYDTNMARETFYGRTQAEIDDADWRGVEAQLNCTARTGTHRTLSSYTTEDRGKFDVYFTCRKRNSLGFALALGLAPALLMAAVGLTMRWIWRGFRPPVK